MKIKSLFLAMVACAGLFVACSDDNAPSMPTAPGQGEYANVPAYISLSFTQTTSTKSTPGQTGEGNADDSGISDTGLPVEGQINSVLAIVAGAANSGVAKYYPTLAEFTDNEANIYLAKNPFKILAGEHNCLIVVNPCAAILEKYNALGEDETGALSAANALDLYNFVIAGKYDGASSNEIGIDYLTKGTTARDNFMMANKLACKVQATAAHTQNSPLRQTIDVERVVAKITFRDSDVNVETGMKNSGSFKLTTSVLDPESIIGDVFSNGAVQTGKTLYKCNYEGSVILRYDVEDSGDITTTYYKNQTNTHGVYDTEVTVTAPTKVEPVYKETKTEEDFATAITDYALINLGKANYYVRQVVSGANDTKTPMIELNGTNYLADPFFDAKIANVSTPDFDFGTYFFNTLKAISDETAGVATAPSYFQSLSSLTDNTSSANPAVGKIMDYAFENATVIDKQKHGISTSIAFKAQLYKKNGSAYATYTDPLFLYGGKMFKTVANLKKAYPGVAAIQALANDATAAQVRDAKIDNLTAYVDGICYYTTQIRHMNNGKPTEMGNMEFAIMRNNIYSLAISSISTIGDAQVKNDPDVNNEDGEAYIALDINVLPWIVRYNDIEF